MPGNPHTSIRSRQVAAELRRIREASGISGAEAAKRLGISASKLSRLETGVTGLQIEDVAALLGMYGAPAAQREELLDLARRSDERGWWTRQPGLPKLWRSLIDFEARAVRIENYEVTFVPGLLQTADYCRAIIQAVEPTLIETEVDALVASRMARQAVLSRTTAPQLLAVVDETVLHRPVGEPGVMRRQLQHLLTVSDRGNVTLRVIPHSLGAHTGLRGPFMLFDFVEEPGFVFVENHNTGLFLEEQADIADYRLALGSILSAALAPGASRDLIAALAADR